jgi:putative transposase
MEADVTAVCGPKGRHDPQRTAVRHGHGAGSVSLGGRRVPVERPRMRAVDGSGELPVASCELFSDTEILGRMALDRMLAGLSTRRYPVALEPVGAHTEKAATATSRSAVSRRFVAQTETALAQLLAADLSQLDLVAFMVDGVHFGEHTCVVALGIDIDGTKHPLSLVEGSTENATLVIELIVGLRERGLDVTRPILAVLDGSKALRRAVLDVFDRPVIGRCQLHKIRNVEDHLPEKLRTTVPWRRGEPARRHGRDPHRVAPGRAAHARAHPPLDQRSGEHDLDLPHPRGQRQALARRAEVGDERSFRQRQREIVRLASGRG